jgi:hypothetical protein
MCGGLRFFIGLRLLSTYDLWNRRRNPADNGGAERFKLKRLDAKSRYLAGLSNAI